MMHARILGGIGAILILLSLVSGVGAIFGILGLVMVLVAVKCIADDLNQRGIFNNTMIAVFLSTVGIAIGSLMVLGTTLNAFQNGYFSTMRPLITLTSVITSQWAAFGTELGLFGAWAFFVASSVFLRRSCMTIELDLNDRMFGRARLLHEVGAATTIVGVEFVMLLVDQILTATAFLSILGRQKGTVAGGGGGFLSFSTEDVGCWFR
jgi:uncharacterized membrane protein